MAVHEVRVVIDLSKRDEIQQLLDSVGQALTTMAGVIEDLVDSADCRLDIDGNCQEHGWFDERPCPHARAHEILENPIEVSVP